MGSEIAHRPILIHRIYRRDAGANSARMGDGGADKFAGKLDGGDEFVAAGKACGDGGRKGAARTVDAITVDAVGAKFEKVLPVKKNIAHDFIKMRALYEHILDAEIMNSRSEEHTSELQSRPHLVC